MPLTEYYLPAESKSHYSTYTAFNITFTEKN